MSFWTRKKQSSSKATPIAAKRPNLPISEPDSPIRLRRKAKSQVALLEDDVHAGISIAACKSMTFVIERETELAGPGNPFVFSCFGMKAKIDATQVKRFCPLRPRRSGRDHFSAAQTVGDVDPAIESECRMVRT